MKIVAVLGSPRSKSNSSSLARRILSKASELGAETQEFVLNKMQLKGCQGCEACKTKSDRCVFKDDLFNVLEAVKEADAVVLASPIYFGDISAQLKSFFDRTYSYLNSDFSSRVQAGKASVFVLAQGQTDLEAYKDVFPRYERWLKHYGFSPNYLIRMNGPRDQDGVTKRSDLMAEAETIAEELAKSGSGS